MPPKIRGLGDTHSDDPSSRRANDKVWPLALIFIGYPIWWLLGVAAFVPLALAIPMAVQLWRKRQIITPGGFGWWMLYIGWVIVGVFALASDAPGAVPGGSLGSRTMVFCYRLCWFLACTIVLLWLANSDRRAIPFQRVANIVGWLFLFCVAGGLAGTLFPLLNLRSLLEVALPKGISGNSFVKSLIHPGLADVQGVLGRPEPRPKAPFAFANSWGSNFSMTLPFFLIGWLRNGRRWQRILGVPVLGLGAVPVVFSLNRGLWASLLVGVLLFVVLQVVRGKLLALFTWILIMGVCLAALVASPLGSMISDRMAHQHSNERRGQLLVETVRSAATGSPVIGFGSTRDVQGSFASIAGGATPDCKACAVPPLGTQGNLWLVIFAQGILGAAFFLVFFIVAFFRSWRCRTTPEALAVCILAFFFLQMFVYDTLDLPLFTVMIAVALAWREQSRAPSSEAYLMRVVSLRAHIGLIKASLRPLVALIALGTICGAGLAASAPRSFESREDILLAPTPTYLGSVFGSSTIANTPDVITIDTEAALVLSESSLDRVKSPYSTAGLRSRVRVTAEPNTSILVITVRDSTATGARQLVAEVSSAYLTVRHAYLQQRRTQMLAALRERFREVSTLGVSGSKDINAELAALDDAIYDITLTPTTAGEVLRSDPPQDIPPNYALYAASGAALGMLVGLSVAVGRDARRHRIVVPAPLVATR